MRHKGPIAGIAAHGHLIATAGYDNRLILWDSTTRQALARANHDHLINQCAFSADGRWLVSASSDYTARLWEVPTLRLHAVLAGHDDDVDMAQFSPDDRLIATCALDRCVRVFNHQGRCLHTLRGHTGNVKSLAWMADSRHLVSSSVDGTLRVWDCVNGQLVSVTDLQIRADSVAIGIDGTVYAGDDRGRIAIVEHGLIRFVAAHSAGIKKIVLDTRRAMLITLSYDGTLAQWRLGGKRGLQKRLSCALPDQVWARAACSLDDGRIAAGTFGGSYAIVDHETSTWDLHQVEPGPALNSILSAYGRVYAVGDAGTVWIDGVATGQMGSLCNFLVAAGGRVYSGGQLGQLYDTANGAVLYRHHGPMNCATSFMHEGCSYLALGCYSGHILILRQEQSGALTLVANVRPYQNAVKGLCSGDGQLFSVCASTAVAWHRVGDWSLLGVRERAHERIANACCALGDGRYASIGRDRTLLLWQGQETKAYPSPHPNSVKCIAVNANRTVLLTGSYGGTLALFDLVSGRWGALQHPCKAGISAITWDDDGHRFLAAAYDGTTHVVTQ